MIKMLPKISYDLSVGIEEPQPVIIPDLMIRVNYTISEKERNKMLIDYRIKENETINDISYKLYDTMDYHWVIMLVNNRFDYISDFPLDDSSLEKHVKRLYGEDKVDAIHHYEDGEGNWVNSNYYDWKNVKNDQPTGVLAQQQIWKQYYEYDSGETTTFVLLQRNVGIPITNFDHEYQLNEEKRDIKVVRPELIRQFVSDYKQKVKEVI